MRTLIIGGCGFIGVNSFFYLKKKRHKISIVDNFSGNSSKKNFIKIKQNYPKTKIYKIDIKNYKKISNIIKKLKPTSIILVAGQIAVTKSVFNPRQDFNDTMLGTFNILESVRIFSKNTNIIYCSSNKVYGNLKNLNIKETKISYKAKNKKSLIDETFNLDFASPYGCSKGSSDQYVRDYSRTYKLKTAVLRLSCVYGPNQWGTQDQGWISWFIKKSINSERINIFGNGKQVRDILYIDDLTRLFEICIKKINKINGEIYNIGGGNRNKISLLELIVKIEKITMNKTNLKYSKERIGDQKFFVNNLSKIKKAVNWQPKVNVNKGINLFYTWIVNNFKNI
jgi:CDP-paratose 2-epimerase